MAKQMVFDFAKKPRGTAAMSLETRREVARKGGLAVSKDRKHMAKIGRKGGKILSQDREYMAEIGSRGGYASHEKRLKARGIVR